MKNNTANTEIISLNTTWAGNTSCHDTSSQDDSHQTPAILAMPWLSYAMLCVAAFLGIPGNILVIAIYAKIGFSEVINISYFALGVSNTIEIIFITWNALCYIPGFVNSGVPFITREIVIPTGGATSEAFGATTFWITAYINLERCLCVVFPLKIKSIITRKRTIWIITILFLITVLPFLIIHFLIFQFDLQYDGERNQTLLRVSFANTSGADNLFNAAFLYRSVVLNFVPLVFTLVCSITLSVHMRKNALWRLRTTSQATGQGETNSSADLLARRKYASDMRVSKIVLTLAAASSVLGFLYALRSLLAVLLPAFKPVEIYGDEYKLISRQLLFLSEINSSVNVIIYYNMGSKFRQTFRRLFRLKNKNNT